MKHALNPDQPYTFSNINIILSVNKKPSEAYGFGLQVAGKKSLFFPVCKKNDDVSMMMADGGSGSLPGRSFF